MLCCARYSLQLLQPHPSFPGGATCSCSCSSPSSSASGNQRQRLHPPSAVSPTTSRSTPPLTHPPDGDHPDEDGGSDDALLALLRAHDTDAAYRLFSSKPSLLPSSPTTASRLLSQLSFSSSSPDAFSRVARLLQSLRARGALDLLDANSLSLAAAAAARSRDARLAHSLLLYMLRQGFLPDRRAYTAAVARLTPPTKALRLFDAVLRHLRRAPPELISPSCLPDTAAFNAALSACADAGDCRRFRQLFDAMSEWSAAADALTYNVVIKMCARAGRKGLVARVLERMLSSGLAPCATTFHSLVAAFVGFGDIPTAERIVQAMREERNDICLLLRAVAMECDDVPDVVQGAALLDDIVAVAKPGQGTDELPLLPKAYPPNARVYTTLMKGYMNTGRVDDVVAVLRAMLREAETVPASRPDHVTYTTVISALVAAGDMARARAVLDEMAAAGVPANRVTYNVLLKGYCQQLQIGKARELFEEMVTDAGIQPGVVTYNTLMDGCVLTDDSAGALAFFNEMRSRGIAPSTVSYTTLMKAFALSGQPKVAHKVFEEMERDPRVAVDRAAWNMLVEGYCRLGLVETAKQVVERMKERGVQPDVATYGSLAKGVAAARKPGEALVLWNEVQERCLEEADEELLGALADVCVRAAFFKKALEIVACMEEKGIAPNKTKYRKMYIEMHSRMFTSKHASQARQDRRRERKRAAEAFKFWLGLPNSYYGSEWRVEPLLEGDDPS
ncbi:pentatricopeptide repeat-containing protein [Panicum miliaceum]|uniref:Pentatricopeptide repeat-containing protein n=1 Tax=Panicum miliaceum TaxID=4540 RepID=A0A3L6QYG5_PANMI|nr:pentatricopeptide repeat-containing protein [Panicum miliaceum]